MLQAIFHVYKLLIKSTQECLGWKKINLSKVSENYRTCVSMSTIVYEELFRYLFFCFLNEFSQKHTFPTESNSDEDSSLVFILMKSFQQFIQSKMNKTMDLRWKYMCGFYQVMSLFKLYESSMSSGNSITMELIESQFCGIFMLLDKHKYVEIILSQIEKKYHDVSYSQLQEIRMNSACRYKHDIEDKNVHFPMHVLDKVMENINMWVKKLPVNHDPKSWITHSPNVCLAQRCVSFEKSEYKQGFINLEKMLKDGIVTERKYTNASYVEPKKAIEKQRVFEFLSKILGEEHSSPRMLDEEQMIAEINNLETKLKKNKKESSQSPSPFEDQDLNQIFDIINGDIPDNVENDELSTDSNTINTNDTCPSIEVENNRESDDVSDNESINSNLNVANLLHGNGHKYSTCDIIELGQSTMKEHDFNQIRNRKKLRRNRHEDFLYQLFISLDGPDNSINALNNWFLDEENFKFDSSSENTYDFTNQFCNLKM